MILTREFDQTVEIELPAQFAANFDANLLSLVRERFEGRCLGSVFVMRIEEIQRRSACRLIRTNLSGHGLVDVRFVATVLTFDRSEFIFPVRILNRDRDITGRFSIETEKGPIAGSVSISSSRTVGSLEVDDLIPVRAERCHYPVNQSGCTAAGPMVTCDQSTSCYLLRGKLVYEDAVTLQPLIDEVTDEMKHRDDLSVDSLLFFESIWYSYPIVRPTTEVLDGWKGLVRPVKIESNDPKIQTVNIIALIKKVIESKEPAEVTGLWCRDLSLFRSSPFVNFIPITAVEDAVGAAPTVDATRGELTEAPKSWSRTYEWDTTKAMIIFLNSMRSWLGLIRIASREFPSTAGLTTNQRVWNAAKLGKLPMP